MSGILNALIGSFAPAGGSFESIATVTGNGVSPSITFSSIPSTYQHLQIRLSAREAAGTNPIGNMSIQVNGDLGSNYTFHQLFGDGSSAGATGNGYSFGAAMINIAGNNAPTSTMGVAIIDILDYANTNKLKTFRSLTGTDINGSGFIILRSQLWGNTAAINSLTLTDMSGVALTSASHFALYGIKAA